MLASTTFEKTLIFQHTYTSSPHHGKHVTCSRQGRTDTKLPPRCRLFSAQLLHKCSCRPGNVTALPVCSTYCMQGHRGVGSWRLQGHSKMASNWTGYLLLNPMERCTMSYTTHQKMTQNTQLTLGVTWPITTWQDLRGTECTPTLQCRPSTQLEGPRGLHQ